MARDLTTIPNITPPDSDYPNGRILNASPPAAGTPVIEELYGDVVQFFHKLMRAAGISHNGLPENETQGFQFIQALAYYVRTLQASEILKGTLEIATASETQAGIDNLRAVTPAGLESKTATTSRKGILETATDAEAQAKTSLLHILTPSNLAALGASTVFAGLIELADNAETLAGTSHSRAVTPSSLTAKDAGIIRKIIDIGDWNMVSTGSVTKTHGLNFTKIRNIQVMIRDDSGTVIWPLDTFLVESAGSYAMDSGAILLTRTATGLFYTTGSFISTSYNRGWIIIEYLP